ncbi:MAG: hypothetical protein RLZZ618_237 [Pseudomonadota bacterium]
MKQRPFFAQPRRPLVTAVAAALLLSTLAPAPLVYAQMPAKRTRAAQQEVTLNFVNAEIDGVARAMGAMLKQQFVVDPRVKGTITLYSEDPMTPREAYLNFLAALRGQGFTVVEAGGLYKVVPEADAKLQSGTVSVGSGVSRQGDQIITQIFKINHENANNLVPVLRPLISPNNTINANPGNNTLVITDYADNLTRLAKIISAMDTPGAGDVEIIPIKFGVASDLAAVVQRLGDGASGPAGAAPAAAGGNLSVLADPRTNSLIVRAPNPARMAAARSIIDKLDRPMVGNANGTIQVVYLKNADAVKLAAVLRAAYGAIGGVGGAAGGGGGGGGASSTSAPAAPAVNPSGGGNNSGMSAAATAPVTASAGPSTGGFIQADPATNSLIITAPEPVYRQLRAVIDQLDSRRAQVYIESMIVEVAGDDAADFGFQWQGLTGQKGDKNIGVAGTNFGSSNILALSAATAGGRTGVGTAIADGLVGAGLNIGLLRDFGNGLYGLAAVARVLQSNSNTNIVSTPNLITLDNEEAKIIVGSNVPFISGSQQTQGGNPFTTIERKDVGITLRIKPQIGENGTVRMTIFQESSSVIDQAAGTSGNGPTTAKRSIESTVVIDDGQIMVLGGLIEDRFTNNKSKVPILGDIPYLGALFRSESRTKKRTNLMVFLRPIVMRDQESASKLSLDRYDLIRAQQQTAQPVQSFMLPINQSPVLPPLNAVTAPGSSTSPAAPAPSEPVAPTQPPALAVPPTPAKPASPAAPASGTTN